MNELQNVELQLLKKFISICETLNIKYYLLCGSALGAVKYNGFIPWDDDIDVGLMRDDYNVFLKKADKLLPKELFLQNSETDEEYIQIFSKLRNSNTTYIETSCAHFNINHGVYIDIFPLDGYPKKKISAFFLEIRKWYYQRRIYAMFKQNKRWKSVITAPLRMLTFRPQKLTRKYEKMISRYSVKSSELICNHGNWQGRKEYAPAWQYGEGTLTKFEGLDVRIPEKYDEYLTQKYGDWKKDLPQEEQVGHHYYKICDVNKPYTEYSI